MFCLRSAFGFYDSVSVLVALDKRPQNDSACRTCYKFSPSLGTLTNVDIHARNFDTYFLALIYLFHQPSVQLSIRFDVLDTCSVRRDVLLIKLHLNQMLGPVEARLRIFVELPPIMICSSILNSTSPNSHADIVRSLVWN